MQLEEEEEPWWGSKWEDGKGEFVSGSLAVWGRGTSSLCRAGVLEICAEAAARWRPPRIQRAQASARVQMATWATELWPGALP